MNINLLAPTNKCSDFNVSFKEPIVIEKNSKVQFNWAKLSRHNGIVLDKDENIIIEPALPLPTRIPDAPGTLNLNEQSFATSNLVTIPKGNYTGKELQAIITEKLNDFVGATNGVAHQAGFNVTGFYEGIDQPPIIGENNILKIGLESPRVQGKTGFRDVNNPTENNLKIVTQDLANHVNSTFTLVFRNDQESRLGDLIGTRYRKTADTGTAKYDNYALGKEHLNHYGVNNLSKIGRVLSETPVGEIWDEYWYLQNGVYAESSKTVKDFQDVTGGSGGLAADNQENLYLGIYSREVATTGVLIRTDQDRTGGTNATTADGGSPNPQLSSNNFNGYPLCYFSVELGKDCSPLTQNLDKDYIIIRSAKKGNDKLPSIEIDESFDDMEIIFRDRLSSYVADIDNYKPKIFISTYFKQNPNYNPKIKPTATDTTSTALLDESKLFFKVSLIGDDNIASILYDSGVSENIYIKGSFLKKYEDIGADTQAEVRINAQIPFNPLLSAQKIGDGWDNVRIKGIDKTLGTNSNANPISVIRGYRFILPNIIARMINPAITTTLSTEFLYPTQQSRILYGETDNEQQVIEDITSGFKDDDVSIYLDNLPLENYKNTELSLNKGLKKNLLVNIPSPFSDTTQSGILLTSKYSPNTPFITDLKNQEFKTNNLRILIKDGKTDRPINDLISASVDFTILKE